MPDEIQVVRKITHKQAKLFAKSLVYCYLGYEKSGTMEKGLL